MTANPYRPKPPIKRHFWNTALNKCDCEETKRIWICGHWVCFEKLKDELETQNVRIIKLNEP